MLPLIYNSKATNIQATIASICKPIEISALPEPSGVRRATESNVRRSASG